MTITCTILGGQLSGRRLRISPLRLSVINMFLVAHTLAALQPGVLYAGCNPEINPDFILYISAQVLTYQVPEYLLLVPV